MRFKMDLLEGKVALVTGGGRGVARGVALELAKAGADVAIVDIDAGNASRVAAEVEQLGRRSISIDCDVSDREAAIAAVERTVEGLGDLHILVNMAHYLAPGFDKPVVELTDDDFDKQFGAGLMGTFYLMRAAYPHLRGGGRIINTASAAGIQGYARMGAYAASKEAIRGLSRVAAREWGADGITVNVVCPSMLTTPGMHNRAERGMTTDYSTRPIPRAGREEDTGGVVVFLASSMSDYVTGETIMVDGGRTVSGGR
jgi:NAD(P)-dependent dehydrogenase (short-subunit alcohol dehydrogenase family)